MEFASAQNFEVVNMDSDGGADVPLSARSDSCEVEVRWLLTGEFAAVVPVRCNMSLVDLKTELLNLVGVPVCDQRLFVNDAEVCAATVSPGDFGPTLMLLRCTMDPCETNLGHFRVPMNFDALPRGEFAQVRRVAKGINGDVFLHRWTRGDVQEDAVVKMLRNRSLERIQSSTEVCERNVHMHRRNDAPDAEDALTEIGVLTYLAKQADLPLYLLRASAVFADGTHTWLVTEHAEGGDLFGVVAASAEPLCESDVKSYMWQLLQAVSYLQTHFIGHRDISLENILLKDGVARIMDFGMAVQSHSACGKPFRYFRATGKDFYRGPECYVPMSSEAVVTPRPGDRGGDVALLRVRLGGDYLCEMKLPADAQPHKACTAQVWGYEAALADIFSAGICFFILTFQSPAWSRAVVADRNFAYVHRHGDGGLEALVRSWNKRLPSAGAMQLMDDMMRPEPTRRHLAAQCLSSPWFAELADEPVPCHSGPLG